MHGLPALRCAPLSERGSGDPRYSRLGSRRYKASARAARPNLTGDAYTRFEEFWSVEVKMPKAGKKNAGNKSAGKKESFSARKQEVRQIRKEESRQLCKENLRQFPKENLPQLRKVEGRARPRAAGRNRAIAQF